MDIHNSKKHGEHSRLYFLTAILVVLVFSAFLLRYYNVFEEESASPLPSPLSTAQPTTVDDSTTAQDVKTEVESLSKTSESIENNLVSAKTQDFSQSKSIYSNQITALKNQYTIIADLINAAKNKNINTQDLEKTFDDLKQKVTLAENNLTNNQVPDLQKNLDLALTSLNSIISLVGNI